MMDDLLLVDVIEAHVLRLSDDDCVVGLKPHAFRRKFDEIRQIAAYAAPPIPRRLHHLLFGTKIRRNGRTDIRHLQRALFLSRKGAFFDSQKSCVPLHLF